MSRSSKFKGNERDVSVDFMNSRERKNKRDEQELLEENEEEDRELKPFWELTEIEEG